MGQRCLHEQRRNPPADFEFGKVYDYPTGDEPTGANCLGECGPSLSVNHGVNLRRGTGHTMAGNSKAGVNGLHEMGANVWEWIQSEGHKPAPEVALGGMEPDRCTVSTRHTNQKISMRFILALGVLQTVNF